MGEMMARMADEAASVLQSSERQLCAHLNALAALTLEASLLPPRAPKSSHKDGRAPDANVHGAEQPSSLHPKQPRSPRVPRSSLSSASMGDDAHREGGQPKKWSAEALAAAEGFLEQSRTVGEHGIAELEGQGKGFSSMSLTAASHRAWRLIQVQQQAAACTASASSSCPSLYMPSWHSHPAGCDLVNAVAMRRNKQAPQALSMTET